MLKTSSLEGLHEEKEEQASWAQPTIAQQVDWTMKGSVGLELTRECCMVMSGSREDSKRGEQTESGASMKHTLAVLRVLLTPFLEEGLTAVRIRE